jgi:hypothetical protein
MMAWTGPAAARRPGIWLAALLLACGSAAAQEASVPLRVEVKRLEAPRDQRVLKVRQDALVRIDWLSDRAAVIHVEGYDVSVAADPGKPERMEFKAHATGRFPVHIHEVDAEGGPARHGHHTRPLLRLEVHPK